MDLNEIIANNVYRLRTQQNLSISQLAEKTGLSKAVLSQLEKGGANPTINTIWKIASALHVPYSSILEPSGVETQKVTRADLKPQLDDAGHYRISCYYAGTSTRDFELFLLELDPGFCHTTEGHNQHSEEFLIIKKGTVKMTVGERSYLLGEEDSLHFDATARHTYENVGKEIAQIYCINYYKSGRISAGTETV